MALVLGLKRGSSFFVGDTKVSLEEIIHPQLFKVRVHGSMDIVYEISSVRGTEILPTILASAGLGNANQVKIALEAPKHIKILRETLYQKAN